MPDMTARPQLPERTPRAKGEPTALDGLLVIDFTRVVAGPACTQTLADFGAEVIKIENPDGGDDTRHYEHAEIGGESAAFLSLNRNKRGIALDFTNPAALEVARALIAKADVVVENFSGGVMKKFGLDYASVAPTNPRLVYCSISAYGRKGSFALRPGFDPVTQAESGFMSLNGFPDGEPVRTGPPIVDMATGMSACNAILMALLARDRLGNWMAKMKKANIPVGYLRTVEEGFNAPEVRDRDRLSRIPHPTAGSVPNIETPLHMSVTPTIDPVAAPLLGQHTKEILRKTLGYDDRRIADLAE